MSIWKVLLTWPYLLHLYWKSGSMTKKIFKEPGLVPESKSYLWLQKKTRYLKWIYSVKVIAHNIENWPKHKGCLLVANHQSNFDSLILLGLNDFDKYAPLGFIAKEELKKDRIARRFVFLIDVLFIDRKDPRTAVAAFQEAKELIRVPRTMAIFPEGTRSHNQEMSDFKPGALKLAYQTYVPILPVSIVNSYQIFESRGKKIIHVIFHPAIESKNFIHLPTSQLAKQLELTIQSGIKEWSDISE